MKSENPGIRGLVEVLSQGECRAADLAHEALDRARVADGVFTTINEGILAEARRVDERRAEGRAGPLEGIPVTLKDLYNVRGERTLAGSRVLRDTAPVEARDAEVVSHLRAAGILFLGRTNMSEFAFSGMGLNPHHPTLYSTWDRDTGRLPGGSSSGSAVSVSLGIVPGTLGSDTAGSCRIPAAFNGIVGVKPSYGRLSLQGVYPLSPTSDAPGPLGTDVDTCFILDHLMSGSYDGILPELTPAAPDRTTLMIPEGIMVSDLDPEVEMAFSSAVDRLTDGGISIIRDQMQVVDQSIRMFLERPVVLHEVWQAHAERLNQCGEEYDPYVRQRMSSGRHVTSVDQQQRYQEKAELANRFQEGFRARNLSAILCPTVACVPPPVSDTEDGTRIGQINLRCLRNTAAVNYLDGCAISLPCHQEGEAPVGLSLFMPHGDDRQLYELAAMVEKILDH